MVARADYYFAGSRITPLLPKMLSGRACSLQFGQETQVAGVERKVARVTAQLERTEPSIALRPSSVILIQASSIVGSPESKILDSAEARPRRTKLARVPAETPCATRVDSVKP